jgi:type I restriction enzyme S subunit
MVWENKSFGDCAELIGDTVQPSETLGLPYIGLEHISQGQLSLLGFGKSDDVISAKSKFRKGDILFGKLRPYFRKVIIAPFDGLCSTDIWVVRAKSGTDQRYLYYWMASEEFVETASRASEGTKMPRAQWEFVEQIQQELPDEPEQRAIAGILGALDDKIELNRRMNATLEGMARAVFRRWFVENEEVGSWKTVKLSEICTTQYGYTASASDISVGPKLLRITDMNKEPWIVWADVPYCEINEKEFEKYRLSLGDILVSRMADPGKAGIVEEEVKAVFASYLVRLKFQNLAWSYFAYYFLRSDQYLEYANGAKSGSVQSGMNARVITDVNVSIPPDEKVTVFYESSKPLRNKIVANLKESRTLANLRDTLLPKLMRGEVRARRP